MKQLGSDWEDLEEICYRYVADQGRMTPSMLPTG